MMGKDKAFVPSKTLLYQPSRTSERELSKKAAAYQGNASLPEEVKCTAFPLTLHAFLHCKTLEALILSCYSGELQTW